MCRKRSARHVILCSPATLFIVLQARSWGLFVATIRHASRLNFSTCGTNLVENGLVATCVYACVYMRVCVCECTRAHICENMCVYVCEHKFVFIYVCTHTCAYVCVYMGVREWLHRHR